MTSKASSWRLFYLIFIGLLALVVAYIYGRPLLLPPDSVATPTPSVAAPAQVEATAVTPNTLASIPAPAPTPDLSTPTPEPGGRIITIRPAAGNVAWWSSGDARHSHPGDSFLYAGRFQGQVFIAAFQLDLSRVPRGAPLRAAQLRLTGLQDDRFHPDAGGFWSASILAPPALAALAHTDFQTLLNAPAAITLLPDLQAKDLRAHRPNVWSLDASALDWLEQQLLDGVTTITVRITGPTGGSDTLFAWDSGAGPATGGDAPTLLLSLGPPPATPPPLPTQELIVTTLTPTPANVLTVAANSLTATAVASTIGTYTPVPPNVVTPTPTAANLATIQALAFLLGKAPVIEHTPTPANAAIATYQARYATAVALTTGTFTPIPTTAVTPILITPTPTPANLATAVAYVMQATARARTATPTPFPYNAFIPTPTFTPWYITPTPIPANAATATAQSFYATAVALTTGTFTPLPPNTVILGGQGTPVPSLYQIGQRVKIVAQQPVNVRGGPGTHYDIVGFLEPETVVQVASGPIPDGQNIWWLIRYEPPDASPIEGWIAGFLIAPLE